MHLPQMVIIDLGSQYTSLIARRLRELNVRSEIIQPEQFVSRTKGHGLKGIILSGGPKSVYDADAPKIPDEVFERDVHILAICYGMHAVTQKFGGVVECNQDSREYGTLWMWQYYARICDERDNPHPLFGGVSMRSRVLMSHGDSTIKLPDRAVQIAETDHRHAIAGFLMPHQRIWCLQFHPECEQTEYGMQILSNFLNICGAEKDWNPGNIIEEKREIIRMHDDPEKLWGLAYSGGVDSSVVAALAKPILGDRLHLITIDGGNLRHGEKDEILDNARIIGYEPHVMNAEDYFLKYLCGVTDAEQKRKIFKQGYHYLLTEMMRIEDYLHIDILAQGSIATDMIESGAKDGSAVIKTHHNVGVPSVTLLDDLFKDEVRALARVLGLPPLISERHPFPGPGLFIRIVGGEVTKPDLDLLREIDWAVRDEVEKAGLMDTISQLAVALLKGVKFVTVEGDVRGYRHPVVVRAVSTSDFMTARGYRFPPEAWSRIKQRVAQFPVACALEDDNDKPKRTIEFE